MPLGRLQMLMSTDYEPFTQLIKMLESIGKIVIELVYVILGAAHFILNYILDC